MAVPSVITDLSTTIASNSPAGSDIIGGNLDNFIRALSAFIRQESINKAFQPIGDAPTYVSVTTFTVPGDQRATYYAGRPIKCYLSSPTVRVGVIFGSTFSVTTTVAVICDGDLDVNLSRIDVGVDPRSLEPLTNYLVNPWFRLWQRNTTFTTAAGTPMNLCDGCAVDPGTAGVVTFSRQAHTVGQTSIPFEPTYFARYNQSTGGTTPLMKQHIEDVRTLAGQQACVWFIAKVSAGTLSVTPRLTQYFGSGGSGNVTTVGTAQTVTTAWKLFSTVINVPSITGKTIGATVTNLSSSLRADLLFPDATTFTLDIAAWGVNRGAYPIILPPATAAEDVARVFPRYWKTFQLDTVPAQNLGTEQGAIGYAAFVAGVGTHVCWYQLPARLRALPTATFYSTRVASAGAYDETRAGASGLPALFAPATSNYQNTGFAVTFTQVAADAVRDTINVHVTLDADWPATV